MPPSSRPRARRANSTASPRALPSRPRRRRWRRPHDLAPGPDVHSVRAESRRGPQHVMLMGMFDHKQTLAYVSAHLSRILANRLREELAPLGLLPAQFTAIAEIARDEGLTQKLLVERLDLEQPGVARTLTTMEAEGWIERRTLDKVQGLFLTARSRDILPRALGAVQALNHDAMRDLSRTEREHLLDALKEAVEGARKK
ncbi:MAG: MarR family transcriptional regulator [Hyphomicrobiales bacterium]|nr:MAG: MarR family transcriptional regulator [Hyphomicrobiales bacterium]